MENILDLLIIGAGPAGMTAAIYASRTWLNFKIIERLSPGGQLIKTDLIDNYPGFPGISGVDLTLKLNDHLEKLGVKVDYEEASEIKEEEGFYKIFLKSGKTIKAKRIIVATGVKPRKLGLEFEEKFEGKGVSYCATCDGFFYKDKVVAVVGKGDSAMTSAIYLSKIAKKVYVINKDGDFKDKGKLYEALLSKDNIEIKYFSNISKLYGNEKIERIEIVKNEDGKLLKEEIELDGIFVLIGNIPNSELSKNVFDICRKREIIVDKKLKTSNDGIYAIGDVVTKSVRQILTAMSDAVIAVEEIEKDFIA